MKERIRHILREERSIKSRIKSMIKDIGVEKTFQMVGGFDNFKKIMNIETPMDYLHLFNGIPQTESEERYGWYIYPYKENNNLMVFSYINNRLYINSDIIVEVLRDEFELSSSDSIDYLYDWLGEEYNLKDDFMIVATGPKSLNEIK